MNKILIIVGLYCVFFAMGRAYDGPALLQDDDMTIYKAPDEETVDEEKCSLFDEECMQQESEDDEAENV